MSSVNSTRVSEVLEDLVRSTRLVDGPMARATLMQAMEKPVEAPYYSFADLAQQRTFALWRILRYTLTVFGYAEANDPLSYIISDPRLNKLEGKIAPVREGKRPEASTLAPQAIYFLRNIPEEGVNLFPVCLAEQEPGEIPPSDPRHATAGLYSMAAEALQIPAQTSFDNHMGLAGLVYGHTGGGYDHFLRIMFKYSPTLDEIMYFEQDFLTKLASSLMETNEDALRESINEHFARSQYEAYSLAQTVKRWSASLRPIDQEMERVLAIRSLEAARDSAQRDGQHAASISATREIAKLAGLHESKKDAVMEEQFRKFMEFVHEREADQKKALEAASTDVEQIEMPKTPYQILD